MAVVVPQGFKLAGVHCGIKRNPQKEDLTLIVSDRPATGAGVYTTNLVCGAPVTRNRRLTPAAGFRAVVINSGNANACTGPRGQRDADEMGRLAAAAFGGRPEQVLVLSTGIIGEFLPLDKIASGIQAAAAHLAADEAALVSAARGMMTTDKRHKLAGRTIPLRQRSVQVTGLAKGAAMIGPRMATMLAVLLVDAHLEPPVAQRLLRDAVDESFNCISVEGHMSTSDSVLLLANGAACSEPLEDAEVQSLFAAVREVCIELARAIPADGEGASHLITIDVRGCRTRDDAHRIAKTVAESALVKTAVAGADPNWGRIVSAAGYSGVEFDPHGVSLHINGVLTYEQGAPAPFDAAALSQSIRSQRDTHIALDFREGAAQCRFWTTDLTAEYVRLNADYHT